MWRQSMQMKWMEPSMLWRARFWKLVLRKAMNSGTDISPDAMANSRCLTAPESADMAVDRHIVGRVGKNHLRLLAAHQGGNDIAFKC